MSGSNQDADARAKRRLLYGIGGFAGLGVLIVLVMLAVTTPESREEYRQAAEAERVAERQADTDARDAADQAERDEAAAANASAITEYGADLTALIAPCDAAQLRVGDALQDFAGADRIAMASDVRDMERACGNAWLGLDQIERPDGLSDDGEAMIDLVEEDCELAFFARKQMAEQLVPIIDGDMRPSVIAALREEMDFSSRQTLACGSAIAPIVALAE